MSTQIIVSDLLVDLSTAQQQLLAGGQQTESDNLLEGMGFGPQDGDQDTDSSDEQGVGTTNLPRRYRIRSQSTKVISVQRLS